MEVCGKLDSYISGLYVQNMLRNAKRSGKAKITYDSEALEVFEAIDSEQIHKMLADGGRIYKIDSYARSYFLEHRDSVYVVQT